MQELRFDLVVVGTGSGLDVANALAREGWRVAVVEKGDVGGTCLNRGCIPSKMLIHSADVAETIRASATFGLDAELRGVDFETLMGRVREHVEGESRNLARALTKSENPRFFVGEGRFVAAKRLRVGETELVAPKFLLAPGARPRIPDIPGLAEAGYLTSTDALSRPTLPSSLVIVGGGFVAAELGHFFSALGTNVTVVQKHDVMLNRDDRELSERFTQAFARRHRVILSATVTSVRRAGAGVRVEVDVEGARQVLEADDVLVAVGLTPNGDTLDLHQTSVGTTPGGHIVVDEHLETSAPGVFALGDAVGRHNLKHAANHEAGYVFNNLRSPEEMLAVNYQAMPRAVFSSPQVAAVGETEDQLRASGVPYLVGRSEFLETAMGKAIEAREGFVKILAARGSGEILGCHVMGPEAATLIHEVVLAMTFGMRAEDIAGTIHIHPALSEVVARAAADMRDPV